jgi:hypothetical protein
MTGYGPADNGSHRPPPGADETWQESFFLSWYDVRRRAGGYHHVDFQPMRNRACIWSWSCAHGVVTNRFQSLQLPWPDGTLDEFTVGPVTVHTVRPLVAYDISVRDDHQSLEHLSFEAFTPLLYQRMELDGSPVAEHGSVGLSQYAAAGTGHYETFGRITGAVLTADGDQVDVDGYAMQDHSWGPRQYGGLTSAHRFLHFTLGTDLFGSLYAMRRDVTDFNYGYISDRGEYHSVADIDIEVAIDRDGHTPRRCAGTVWTTTGRGYEFDATVHVSSVSTHDGGYFSTDAYGPFRIGGRVGSGLIAVRERSAPSSEHRRWLGRDAGVGGG